MSKMPSVNIEPCPFCNHAHFNAKDYAGEFVTVEPHDVDGALHVSINWTGYYWVECGNCYAKGPHYAGRGRNKLNKGPVNPGRDHAKTAQAIIAAIEAWNLRERPEPDLFTLGGEQ